MYTIKWETWKNLDGCHEFMKTRKANLKHTTIAHIVTGWEFDPDMPEYIYIKHSPILIWLN